MLDVRPIDVPPGELEIRVDRLARVVRVADDHAADDEQAVAVKMLDRFDGRVADRAAVHAARVLGARLEKGEILVEHVLDPEEHVAKSRAPHERRQLAPCSASGDVIACTT